MWHAIWHALHESIISFFVIFVVYILIELVENKISNKLQKTKKFSPIFGALFGLIPQCGFSVVATDLYVKRHITVGTLLAMYIATSDEALPLLISNPDKILVTLPLIALKFVLAFAIGYLVDVIYIKSKKQVHSHEHECEHEEEVHSGCCHHHIEGEKKTAKEIILHPLLHSLKIFAYILVINLVFSITMHFVGEDVISKALQSAKYFSPLIATFVGLIPNCAASMIVAELFIKGSIGFGACFAGLICNAGLGLMFLFKDNKNKKENFSILAILIGVALIFGYAISFILGFK
jgi:hypothetical protein